MLLKVQEELLKAILQRICDGVGDESLIALSSICRSRDSSVVSRVEKIVVGFDAPRGGTLSSLWTCITIITQLLWLNTTLDLETGKVTLR
jgi:hypothetical protein